MKLIGKFQVTDIVTKTTAKGFSELKVGDTFIVELPLPVVKGAPTYGYVPSVKITINNVTYPSTVNRLAHILGNFKLQQVISL